MTLWTPANLPVAPRVILDPGALTYSGSNFSSGSNGGSSGGSWAADSGTVAKGTALNGLTTLAFTGTQGLINAPATFWPAGNVYVFAVVAVPAAAAKALCASAWGAGEGANWVFYPRAGNAFGGSVNESWHFNSGAAHITRGDLITDTSYHIICSKLGASGAEQRHDGTVGSPTIIAGGVVASTSVNFRVGASGGSATEAITANLAYLAVMIDPSVADIQNMEGWAAGPTVFNMQASLPVGHPYKSAAPTLSTAWAGSAALAPAAALAVNEIQSLKATTAFVNAAAISAKVFRLKDFISASLVPAAGGTRTAHIWDGALAALSPVAALTANLQKLIGQQAFAPSTSLLVSEVQRELASAALAPTTTLSGDVFKPPLLGTAALAPSASLSASLLKLLGQQTLAPSTTVAVSEVQRHAASAALAPAAGFVIKPLGPQFTLVQNAFNDINPGSVSATTIPCSFGAPVTSGGFVWGIVANGPEVAVTGVTDDQGNIYNLGTMVAAGQIFWLGNINNAPTTLTATFASTATFRSIAIQEWSGVAANADPSDGHNQAFQASPGTGVDAVTSGSTTPSTDGDLILGGYLSDGGVADIISAGTGWTKTFDNFSNVNTDLAFEARVQTSAAGVAATWRQSTNPADGTVSVVLAVHPNAIITWLGSSTAVVAAALSINEDLWYAASVALSPVAAMTAVLTQRSLASSSLASTAALGISERLREIASAALQPAPAFTIAERQLQVATAAMPIAALLTSVGQIRLAALTALAPAAALSANPGTFIFDTEVLSPAAALASLATQRMLASSVLTPLSVLAVGENLLLRAQSALAPAAAFTANPQTYIFDTETLTAATTLAVSTVQRMAASIAATPVATLVSAEIQRQLITTAFAGNVALSAQLMFPGPQQWLASALLGPASILGLSSTQMLAGTLALAPATALTANPQVYSPGLVALVPAAALAISERMRMLASAALTPVAVLTNIIHLTMPGFTALAPAALLTAPTANAWLASSKTLAAQLVLTSTSMMRLTTTVALHPSNVLTTAEVQQMLAETGMTGSSHLATPVVGINKSGASSFIPEALLAVVQATGRLQALMSLSASLGLFVDGHVQPNFLITLANEVMLTSNFRSLQAANLSLAGNALFGGKAVQYYAARLSLGNEAMLQAVLTLGHSATAPFSIKGGWKSKAAIIQAATAKFEPALFTDLHIRQRRVTERSAVITAQRQVAQIFARRSKISLKGSNSADRIWAKGGFVNTENS